MRPFKTLRAAIFAIPIKLAVFLSILTALLLGFFIAHYFETNAPPPVVIPFIAFEKVDGCPPSEYPDARCHTHKTKIGDTLALISRQYNVSSDAIRARNPQRHEALDEALPKNQTLVLPLVNGKDAVTFLKKEIGEKQKAINALKENLIKLADERDQAIKEKEEQENVAEEAEEKIIFQDDLIRALQKELSEAKSRNKAASALLEQSLRVRAQALKTKEQD